MYPRECSGKGEGPKRPRSPPSPQRARAPGSTRYTARRGRSPARPARGSDVTRARRALHNTAARGAAGAPPGPGLPSPRHVPRTARAARRAPPRLLPQRRLPWPPPPTPALQAHNGGAATAVTPSRGLRLTPGFPRRPPPAVPSPEGAPSRSGFPPPPAGSSGPSLGTVPTPRRPPAAQPTARHSPAARSPGRPPPPPPSAFFLPPPAAGPASPRAAPPSPRTATWGHALPPASLAAPRCCWGCCCGAAGGLRAAAPVPVLVARAFLLFAELILPFLEALVVRRSRPPRRPLPPPSGPESAAPAAPFSSPSSIWSPSKAAIASSSSSPRRRRRRPRLLLEGLLPSARRNPRPGLGGCRSRAPWRGGPRPPRRPARPGDAP